MSTELEKRWTPGPWAPMENPEGNNCDVLAWDIYANDAPTGSRLPAQASSEANAQLISAAPELVEALEASNEFLLEDRRCLIESITDANGNITDPADGDGLKEIDALLEKNRAALAKAYGEGTNDGS